MPSNISVHADQPPPLVSEPSDLQYAVGPQIGKGGFAICHRAELLLKEGPTGRIVALKIVKSKMEPPKLAQKFVTELQIHSKLNHPNIVQFYRAFSFVNSTYVVLEICDNGSLADALKIRKCFTMPEIRRFVIQTCGAVKYLHHRNIVHRDLKTGNLFLDENMNIKVGDFGLAAVLLTQNDIGTRRTTMCGTPNYLAPEILEKGGKGHNEKVDLWAIGIIAYTLAVGRAPFHAAKREEIYKKLQLRDYQWPSVNKLQNDISNDLRDLVGALLVHEDDRPSPDEIVSHAFFRMTFNPLQLDSSCISRAPKWEISPPSAETKRRGFSDSWYKLCKQSGVGHLTPTRTFPVIGASRKLRPVVRDCEKEMAAGKQPIVPIPAGSVYLPFPECANPLTSASNTLGGISEEKESAAEATFLTEATGNRRAKPLLKTSALRKPPMDQEIKENEDPQPIPHIAQKAGRERLRVTRTVSESAAQVSSRVGRTEGAATRSNATLRDTAPKAITVSEGQPYAGLANLNERLAELESRRSRAPATADQGPTDLVAKRPSVRKVEAVRKSSQEPQGKPDHAALPLTTQRPRVAQENSKVVSLTDPDSVLARLAKLRDNLQKLLSSRATTSTRSSAPAHLPYVTKWVDYSRKHGLGYVLSDGSIGCLMTATHNHPVTAVIVREGTRHLSRIGKDISHLANVPFEHYTCDGQAGIAEAVLEPQRGRAAGILWAKFGKYMCQQLGQVENSEPKNPEKRHLVRFYQRLGDVVLWGFANGALQFNFPDHTKLVISPQGTSCTFTCLSLDAVTYLHRHGALPFQYMRERQVISQPLANLLQGPPSENILRETAQANFLRQKLQFIRSLVDQWVGGGGLGCKPEDADYVSWKGPRLEDGKKEEWVTVGRFGGDGLREA